MRGSDLWWHLAIGRLILERQSLPVVDSWSFTRDGQPWLQHEWLSDVFLQAWVALFGMNALVYWKWLIITLTFSLLFHVTRKLAGDSVSAYVAVLLAIATAAPFLDIRPHLFSALGYVLILFLVLRRGNLPLFLPLLFLVWVNLHGGFFFGLMALFVLLLPFAMRNEKADRRRAGLIWLACVFQGTRRANRLPNWLPQVAGNCCMTTSFPCCSCAVMQPCQGHRRRPPIPRFGG